METVLHPEFYPCSIDVNTSVERRNLPWVASRECVFIGSSIHGDSTGWRWCGKPRRIADVGEGRIRIALDSIVQLMSVLDQAWIGSAIDKCFVTHHALRTDLGCA